MKKKAFRVAFTVTWAAVCIALIFMLVAGRWGGFPWVSGIQFGGSGTAELLRQENAPSQSVERLEISAHSQGVRIFAVDGGEFAVRHYGPGDLPEDEQVQVRQEGGALRVSVPDKARRRTFFFFGYTEGQRLEIDVPRDWAGGVTASTSSGGVIVEDSFSWKSADLKTSSGGIHVKDTLRLTEQFYAKVSSGGIRLNDVTAASASLKSTSGGVSVTGALALSGELDASASSGGLRLGMVTARSIRANATSGGVSADVLETDSFDLSTSSGGLSIGKLTGNGRLKSTSGGVRVNQLIPTGTVDATASSGGITLAVPSDVFFRFDASCTSGSIKSDYNLSYSGSNNKSATYENGTGGPAVNAHSTSGGIRLNRG